MQIEFTRTGGVTGMRLSKTFDTDKMPVETASELSELVDAAHFFELPDMASPGGADRFQYKIAIERDDQSHTVQIGERSIPAALAPLVKKLEALTRSR
jgi:hypothetical protein